LEAAGKGRHGQARGFKKKRLARPAEGGEGGGLTSILKLAEENFGDHGQERFLHKIEDQQKEKNPQDPRGAVVPCSRAKSQKDKLGKMVTRPSSGRDGPGVEKGSTRKNLENKGGEKSQAGGQREKKKRWWKKTAEEGKSAANPQAARERGEGRIEPLL